MGSFAVIEVIGEGSGFGFYGGPHRGAQLGGTVLRGHFGFRV